MVRLARAGQGPYHHQATGGQLIEPVTHQVAKPALHQIADYGDADGLADDETRTHRGNTLPRCVRVRCTATEMDDEERAARPASSAYRGRKVLAPPQTIVVRQHGMDLLVVRLLRPTGGRDPCHGGTRESRGRHGCACAGGSRGSSRDGGCSAGRCACSLGGSRNESVVAGHRLAVTVRPREARNARVHRFLTAHRIRRDLCPSEAGGSSHRQLDLVTVRAATPFGQTGSAPGIHRSPPRAGGTTRLAPWHICTHPVDNDLNRAPRAAYRG